VDCCRCLIPASQKPNDVATMVATSLGMVAASDDLISMNNGLEPEVGPIRI
jgi:hypothetical protein